jgi:hypothetical protein
VKLFRLRRLNAAEAAADQASDLQSPVRREAQPEQREQHRQLSRVHRRSSKNVVAGQRDDPVKREVPHKVSQDRLRRRVKSRNLRVGDSERRRLPAQVNVSSLAEVRRLDFVNRSRLRRVADLRVKHPREEKELRAHMTNRLRRQPVERAKLAAKDKEYRPRKVSGSSNRAAARLVRPSAARDNRDKDSRKVERREHQKKRHRQGSNNFAAIFADRRTPLRTADATIIRLSARRLARRL